MSKTDLGHDSEARPNTPLWVKIFGGIIIVLILLFVTLHISGHSPMSHIPRAHKEMQQP